MDAMISLIHPSRLRKANGVIDAIGSRARRDSCHFHFLKSSSSLSFISSSLCGLQCPPYLRALFEVLLDINFVQRKSFKCKKEMGLEEGEIVLDPLLCYFNLY